MSSIAWIAIGIVREDMLLTGAGFVDRATACGRDPQLWGDAAVIERIAQTIDTSTRHLRRHVRQRDRRRPEGPQAAQSRSPARIGTVSQLARGGSGHAHPGSYAHDG